VQRTYLATAIGPDGLPKYSGHFGRLSGIVRRQSGGDVIVRISVLLRAALCHRVRRGCGLSRDGCEVFRSRSQISFEQLNMRCDCAGAAFDRQNWSRAGMLTVAAGTAHAPVAQRLRNLSNLSEMRKGEGAAREGRSDAAGPVTQSTHEKDAGHG
jgi:hypothetical protein